MGNKHKLRYTKLFRFRLMPKRAPGRNPAAVIPNSLPTESALPPDAAQQAARTNMPRHKAVS